MTLSVKKSRLFRVTFRRGVASGTSYIENTSRKSLGNTESNQKNSFRRWALGKDIEARKISAARKKLDMTALMLTLRPPLIDLRSASRRRSWAIPDTAKEKPQEGKVVAVGKGKLNDDGKVTPLDVKVNDRVLFGKYSGTEINIDGDEHLIMREEDILGVIEK